MYIHELNMSSSSSESEQSSNSVRQGLLTDSGDEDVLVVNLVVNPCESEPLVPDYRVWHARPQFFFRDIFSAPEFF